MLNGELDAALADFERAFGLAPMLEVVRANKGRVLAAKGRFEDAAEILASIRDRKIAEEALYPLATAYALGGRPREALPLLNALRNSPGSHVHVTGLIIQMEQRLGRTEEAARELAQLLKERVDDAEVAVIEAQAHDGNGNMEGAIAAFDRARIAAKSSRKDHVLLAIGDFYFRHRRYSEATDAYRQIIATDQPTPITEKYLYACVKTGELQDALELTRSIRAASGLIPAIASVEAAILEQINDLSHARELLSALSNQEPGNAAYKLRMVSIDFRLGCRDRAAEVLADISDSELGQDPHLLLEAARLNSWLGTSDGLELAYRALKYGFTEADVHLHFIAAVLNREKLDGGDRSPSVVELGSAVHLEREGETVVYTIIEADPSVALKEIGVDDPIAKLLIGMKKGDEIVLKDSPIERLCFRISKIQTRYVFAFQDSIANFSRRFPAHDGISSMQFDPSDPAALLAILERRRQLGSDVADKYNTGKLPLATLASLVGRTVAEIWHDLSATENAQIWVTGGNPQELDEQQRDLSYTGTITLDITCLLGLHRAGVLNKISEAFRSISIAQPVADELSEEILMMSMGPERAGTISNDGGTVSIKETTVAEREIYKKELQALQRFIFDHGNLRPTTVVLRESLEERERATRIFGRSTAAAISVAREEECCLCADDRVLRAIAKNSWGTRSASTQAVLRQMLDCGSISRDEYHRAVVRILMSNYRVVFVGSDVLIWALEEYQLAPTPEIQRLFDLFSGPACDEDSAVGALAQVAREAYLRFPFPQARSMLLDQICRTLLAGRKRDVLSKFLRRMRVLFHLFPQALNDVVRTVQLWSNQPRE